MANIFSELYILGVYNRSSFRRSVATVGISYKSVNEIATSLTALAMTEHTVVIPSE